VGRQLLHWGHVWQRRIYRISGLRYTLTGRMSQFVLNIFPAVSFSCFHIGLFECLSYPAFISSVLTYTSRAPIIPHAVNMEPPRLQSIVLSRSTSQKYQLVQGLECKHLIHTQIGNSGDLSRHFHRYSASLIVSLEYGRPLVIVYKEEEELHSVDTIMRNFTDSCAVG